MRQIRKTVIFLPQNCISVYEASGQTRDVLSGHFGHDESVESCDRFGSKRCFQARSKQRCSGGCSFQKCPSVQEVNSNDCVEVPSIYSTLCADDFRVTGVKLSRSTFIKSMRLPAEHSKATRLLYARWTPGCPTK
jgi:hypothetical protein